MSLFSWSILGSETKESEFWKWFQKNDARLFSFESNRDAVFRDLNEALKKIDAGLTFEFGPVEHGHRDFVISAAGIKSVFPAVESLFDAAPKMPRWNIIKFRPRRLTIHDIEFGTKKVRVQDVRYLLFKDQSPTKIGIMLFLDGYTEGDRELGQIGFLFLDEALGEYAMETKVGAVVFQPHASQYFERAHPLTDLPNEFDRYFSRTN